MQCYDDIVLIMVVMVSETEFPEIPVYTKLQLMEYGVYVHVYICMYVRFVYVL